jgi:hypothetical protein
VVANYRFLLRSNIVANTAMTATAIPPTISTVDNFVGATIGTGVDED